MSAVLSNANCGSSLVLHYLANLRRDDIRCCSTLVPAGRNPSTAGHSIKHLSCRISESTRAKFARRFYFSCSASAQGVEQEVVAGGDLQKGESPLRPLASADWDMAKAYKESGDIYEGRIEGFNGGGLLVQFHSLVGFLPYPLLSPYYPCKEPNKSIQEIAKGLVGSSISVKVMQVDEDARKLIFSEKDASWCKFSNQVNEGDIFDARVDYVEDYGAFVHLRFPDGCYYLTGLVHVSEVSWDFVQDVRDVMNVGDEVKVKVIQIDREKSRIKLSLRQLEDDPLLETLDEVIPKIGSQTSDATDLIDIEPLPGLESICKELLQEEGVTDVKIGRKGFKKRVVSQDLELWLSNAPVKDRQFTLLARAGREVQQVYLTSNLNQEEIKKAVQRVLARIP